MSSFSSGGGGGGTGRGIPLTRLGDDGMSLETEAGAQQHTLAFLQQTIQTIKDAKKNGASPRNVQDMVNNVLKAWQQTASLANTLLNNLFVVKKEIRKDHNDSNALYYVNANGRRVYLKKYQLRQCATDQLPGTQRCSEHLTSSKRTELEEEAQRTNMRLGDRRSQHSLSLEKEQPIRSLA